MPKYRFVAMDPVYPGVDRYVIAVCVTHNLFEKWILRRKNDYHSYVGNIEDGWRSYDTNQKVCKYFDLGLSLDRFYLDERWEQARTEAENLLLASIERHQEVIDELDGMQRSVLRVLRRPNDNECIE